MAVIFVAGGVDSVCTVVVFDNGDVVVAMLTVFKW